MSRIRTIKPSIWGSPTFSRLSSDAKVLFIGLITRSDDDGRALGSINSIIGDIFPNDEAVTPAKARKWLNEITEMTDSFIGPVVPAAVEYEVGGIKYICFPKWHKHQRINRYTPSSFPPPPGITCTPRGSVKDDE